MSLKRSIAKLAGTLGADTVHLLTCTVESVNIADRSCMVTPVNSELASFPAYLMAETDDGILLVPAKDSTVKIVFSNLNAPFVVQYSQIDQILFISGNQSISIKNALQQFNDGAYGGLLKLLDPASSDAGVLARLNKIEKLVNDLVSKFNGHTHTGSYPVTGGGGGTASGTSAAPTPTEGNTLTLTKRGDIENSSITHGKDV